MSQKQLKRQVVIEKSLEGIISKESSRNTGQEHTAGNQAKKGAWG